MGASREQRSKDSSREEPRRSDYFSSIHPLITPDAREFCRSLLGKKDEAAIELLGRHTITAFELNGLRIAIPVPFLNEDSKWDIPVLTSLLKPERFALFKAVIDAEYDLFARYPFKDEKISVGEHALLTVCKNHRNRQWLEKGEKEELLLPHARLLLDRGVNPNHAPVDGHTSLWEAVGSLYSGFGRFKPTATGELRNMTRERALKAGLDRADLVMLLLEHGADPTVRHGEGRVTVADLARDFYGDAQFGEMLLTAEGRAELTRILES